VFVGSHTHAIDTKGRVSVPKRFLDHFRAPGDPRMFFATVGLDGCIFLLPQAEFDAMAATVRAASIGSEEARAFGRRFFSSTRELEVDAAGRILMPKELRDSAAIGDEVLFVGVDTRIELWSPQRWATHDARHGDRYEEHAKGIFRA